LAERGFELPDVGVDHAGNRAALSVIDDRGAERAHLVLLARASRRRADLGPVLSEVVPSNCLSSRLARTRSRAKAGAGGTAGWHGATGK